MKYLFLMLIMAMSCREFYDEEFLEAEKEQNREGGTANDISYSANLSSTDPNLPAINGNAIIEIENNEVHVKVDVENIPANVIQIHYGYIAASCDQLNISIPNENTTTRTYTVNETTSVDALANDLKSSGATTSDGDINLVNKSFVVKAFSNFSGIPNPSGTNEITVLCGDIRISTSDDDDDASGIGTTTTTGTDGSTSGTVGSVTTTGF